MSKHRPLSVVIGVGSAAFLALPIALTTYVGSRNASVDFPTYHTSESGPNWAVTPISDHKAKAVHDFKLSQI